MRAFPRLLAALAFLAAPALGTAALAQSAAPRPSVPSAPAVNQFWMLGERPPVDSNTAALVGTRSFVWNAAVKQAGIVSSFYMPCCRDPINGLSGHDYGWFLANHPDWLVWGSADPAANPQASTTTAGDVFTGNTITVTSAAGIIVGAAVVGPAGIPKVDKVSAIVGNVLTLTDSVTAPVLAGTALTFFHPNKDVASSTFIDVDVNNPEVRQYMLDYAIANGVAAGFNAIGFDNFQASNSTSGRVGSYVGSTPGCPQGPPACGGAFVQRYASPVVQYDPVYAADQIDYARWLRARLHAIGIGAAANVKSDRDGIPAAIQLALNFDVVLHESPYLHGCVGGNTDLRDNSSGYWSANSRFFRTLAKAGVPVMSANYLCTTPTSSVTLPPAVYGIGSFMLFKGANSAFEIQGNVSSAGTGADSGSMLDYSNLNGFNLAQAWGAPAADSPDPVQSPNGAGGCFERRYAKGLVVVWPYPTGSCSYTVPAIGTWVDFSGAAIAAGAQTLGPDTSVTPNRGNAAILRRTD